MRSSLLLFTLAWCMALRGQPAPEPSTVNIGVLSLFHPKVLLLSADMPLTLLLDGSPHVLDAHRGATLRASQTGLTVELSPTELLPATTLTVAPSSFTLAVPQKLQRTYRGGLTVTMRTYQLVPIIAMETELAVASIVAAEAQPGTPVEALKAQAVASRSYLIANGKAHAEFDACDTTHCQYLRSPPPPTSPAALATQATRNLVLTWRASHDAPVRIVAARYSRSCGGHTRVPVGIPAGSYPYYAVPCAFCLRHPELWSRPAGTPDPATEQDRLAHNRAHGWSAIPSNTHTAANGELQGRGTGHGVGLCQLGASDFAARGATFRQILGHYFPNTTLSVLP